MACTFALARTVGDVRVAALKSKSASRGIARATARPVAASLGRVAVRAMPGAVATRGFSLKVAATADDRIEINSRATPARAVESSEHARSAPAAPAKKFAVPALAFAAAVAAMAPAGPAAAAAAAVATINQADTAWILISTGTSPNARPPRDRNRTRTLFSLPDETPRGCRFAGKMGSRFEMRVIRFFTKKTRPRRRERDENAATDPAEPGDSFHPRDPLSTQPWSCS